MNIAIIGHGRMGKEVKEMAKKRGHHICCIIDTEAEWEKNQKQLKTAEVAIDFTYAEAVEKNINRCFEFGIPVVTGTTGWDKTRKKMKNCLTEKKHTLFFAPNFSIGVNLLFEMNRKLSNLIRSYEQYSPEISETHHIHKKDAPSGTAVNLAEDILARHDGFREWVKENKTTKDQLPVKSIREDEVIGEHTVTWDSEVDTLQLHHHAKNRSGFALGAVVAAEWVKDKKGYFEMPDMLFATD